MSIKHLTQQKVVTIDQNEKIVNAMELMDTKAFNGLVVTNSAHKVVGVLSIQDIAAAIVPSEFEENIQLSDAMYKQGFFEQMCAEIGQKTVKECMRTDIVTAHPDTHIMTITAEFLRNDLYIVPIIDKGNLVGVLTRSEMKHAILKGMQQ